MGEPLDSMPDVDTRAPSTDATEDRDDESESPDAEESESPEIETDLVREEIRIDGICGVY